MTANANSGHMATRLQRHLCGGAILIGESNGESYRYCDTCRAYSFVGQVPAGTDATANQQAWDNAENESPSE